IEEPNFDNEVFFGSSELTLKDNVQFFTTTNAALYPISNSLAPICDSEPVINNIEVKEYLSSTLRYKCLSLSEDLVYSKEELQDEAILIEGKRLVIDLGGHTLTVPDSKLTITASITRIRNGNLKAIADEATTSSFTIMVLNGCKAVIENVQAIGSIKTDNASVTFKDVVINSAF
ncbi:MAG: hypothetical protein K2J93_04990, partial [Anaeroplasmataceae bacterium]|nr:hypothetical protein [Anaeroplasmataceae bacterium]